MHLDSSRVAALAVLLAASCGPGAGNEGDIDADLIHPVDASDPSSNDGPITPTDGAMGTDAGMTADANPADLVSLAELYVASTHNSYSGGDRGSITAQLDAGVRMVELDVHDNDFATEGYRVGHDEPGNQVAHGRGNPGTDDLASWLAMIGSWSEAHPTHAPITVLLDLKDNLDDNQSYATGDITNLHDVITGALGSQLYRADAVGDALPTIAEVRGKILVVMSGNGVTRVAYRRDLGKEPAVALNAGGRVIEVHSDPSGDELFYWTGEVTGSGVRWRRHTRYDTGVDAAVALNDSGLVIEVHEDQDSGDDTLWYRVGRLGDDFEVTWGNAGGLKFPGDDTGVNPSVRFDARDGLTVREIHESPKDGEHWYWDGTIDPDNLTLTWSRGSDGGQTSEPLFAAAHDEIGGMAVDVSTGTVDSYGPETLRVRVADGEGPGDWAAIRYEQILFDEVQAGQTGALSKDQGVWVVAAAANSADGRTFVQSARAAGRIGRLWQITTADQSTDPPPNFPATDTPSESWYLDFCASIGCRQ